MSTLTVDESSRTDTLSEILVQDLYRRSLVPLLTFIPILYVLYRVLEGAATARPIISWVFIGMILALVPRLVAVTFANRIRARFRDPRVRVGIFAVSAGALGCCMAAVNILAAPIVGPEELAIMVIVAAGINSVAIVSMSPSLLSYLLYMVPNIVSVAIAVVIGPVLLHGGILLFLIGTNLFSLIFMATFVHLGTRRSIVLRLQVDAANASLRETNTRLETEVKERLVAEAALRHRNVELEVMNRRLADAHTQLVQSEKLASVGQLAAGIAHEINNPLAFVHSNLRCLGTYTKDLLGLVDAYDALDAGQEDRETAVRRVQLLRRAANMDMLREDVPSLISESSQGLSRVEGIVRDLREFTNIDHAEWQHVDLHESLERTLSVAAHQIKSKAEIVREYGELPLVDCVPAQINQALLNVLVNAVQAIEGRGTITLRTGSDPDRAWISITDTGCGIDPSNLNRIFDPFFTTRDVGSGMGLGLSIVYRVMQHHGGSVNVASTPGQGATFTLSLPISRGFR